MRSRGSEQPSDVSYPKYIIKVKSTVSQFRLVYDSVMIVAYRRIKRTCHVRVLFIYVDFVFILFFVLIFASENQLSENKYWHFVRGRLPRKRLKEISSTLSTASIPLFPRRVFVRRLPFSFFSYNFPGVHDSDIYRKRITLSSTRNSVRGKYLRNNLYRIKERYLTTVT